MAAHFIGPKPSVEAVDRYFTASTLLLFSGTRLLPPWMRPVVHIAITVVQVKAIYASRHSLNGFCVAR